EVLHAGIFTGYKRRNEGKRMGGGRLCLCDRGCLCGSSFLWGGDHQPSFREPRLPGGHHFPAGLAEKRKHPGVWETAPGFSCDCRKYGLYGESLYGFQKTPKKRRLFTRGEN